LFSTSHQLLYDALILLVEWLTNENPCQKFLTFMTHRHVQVEMVEQPSVYIPARRAHRDTCTWCSAVGYCMLHCWRWRQYALVPTDPRTGNSVQTLN